MKLRLLFLFIFLSACSFAQNPFGNEWIKNNQTYLKLKVTENGLYKVTYTQLQAANFLSGNPKNFQLFLNGKEIPISISGEADGTFDPSDYILFYGKKNDGSLDKSLYDNPDYQPNGEVSLFTDESDYFLTYQTGTAGKRFQNISLSAGTLTPEPFIIYTASENYTDQYYPGKYLLDVMSLSEFINGEGYMGSTFEKGTSQNKVLQTLNRFSGSSFIPYLEWYVAGRSDANSTSSFNHHLRVAANSVTLKDTLFREYQTVRSKNNLSIGSLTNATVVTFSSVDNLGATTDYQAPAYARITYPRTLDANGVSSISFKVNTTSAQSLLRFTNSLWQNAILLDTAKATLYVGNSNGNNVDFVINNPANTSLIALNTDVTKSPVIEKISFNLLDALSFKSDLLIVTHKSLLTAAQDFSQYKASKGFKPLVVTTDDLYNQFYYGVHHPLAIRNMAKYLLSKATVKPEYLLLLGKGYETPRNNTDQDLVPTMGYPASDAAFTSQIIDNNLAPALATGRIPAKTNQDITDYLNKLKAYDNLPDSLYRKNFIHVTGGKDAYEFGAFKNYQQNLATIATQGLIGAKIYNFDKNLTDPVSDNLTAGIISRINQGAGFLSFLGHGSTNSTAVSLGNPSDLANNRILFYLINGCSTGNAFTTSSLGETFILSKDRGAIAWIGTSSEGVASYLYYYSFLLYNNLFKNNYGKSVAKNMAITTRVYQNQGGDALNMAHARQYIYLGDPTVSYYSPAKPDYEVTSKDIILSTANLNANSKLIKFGIVVKNLGKATQDQLSISLKRTLEDKSVINYPPIVVKPVLNTDTVYYEIDNTITNSTGNNIFAFTLDPANAIDELSEANNSASFNFFIPGNGISIISPAMYAIESKSPVMLQVQNNNLFTKSADYIFEIDTVNTFNSSFKKSTTVSSGLFASWQPNVVFETNKVYYWRARLNLSDALGGTWQNSSFTYIPGSGPGWNQGHYQQFDKITLYRIQRNQTNNSFQYANTTFPILIKTHGDQGPAGSDRFARFSISSGKLSFNTPDFQGISIVTLYPVKQDKYLNYPSQFNYKNDGINGTGQFYFNPNNPAEADSLVNYINNIPAGFNVVGFSGLNISFKTLPQKVKTALNSLGLTQFETVGLGEPYEFSGKKGSAPGSGTEKTADYTSSIPARQQEIILNVALPYPWNSGYYLSEKFGPSQSWKSASFDFTTDNADQIRYSVIGVKENGLEETLINNVSTPVIDLTGVSSITYPYLRLKAEVTDNVNLTAANLKSWKILFDPYDDLTINPEIISEFKSPQLNQGDSLKLKLGISNFNIRASDSVVVEYKIVKSNRTEIKGLIATLAPINANASIKINFSYPTEALPDSNSLQVTIHPKNLKDRLSFNNQVGYSFVVVSDKKAPLVDVMFDGRRIINGDIVSPKPKISIAVTDENSFLLLNDTTSVEVYLYTEKSNSEKRVYFSSNKIALNSSGVTDKNTATYVFQPELLVDGKYKIRVRSKDKLGNYVSSNDYEIAFEVINEQSITNFLPYPNPFTTSMRFVFRLTGQKVPDKIKIQIMTVTGKIVREILKDELGDIRIGNNVSAFAWNGTDQYGDRLANGVYFYKVFVENSDKSTIKHSVTESDNMFKQNFGKIYLMR